MISRACSSVLVACALGAGGCDASFAPIGLQKECPVNPIRGPVEAAKDQPPELMISDFDSGTIGNPALPLLNQVVGRDGSWVAGAAATTIDYTADGSSECSARGTHAGHFTISGPWASWGVNWTALFHPPITTASGASEAVPYDGRNYSGISLWAAFGSKNPADFDVRIGISTMDTAWNGGICVSPNCSDHYLTAIKPAKLSWQKFSVQFSEMKQMGYGAPQVPTMRKDQMVGFIIWPTQQFDIWIDDVRFEP